MNGGDRNSKFFHSYASARMRKYYVNRLKGPDGDWLEGDAIKPLILDYLCDIFTANGNTGEELTRKIEPRVTAAQNALLTTLMEKKK